MIYSDKKIMSDQRDKAINVASMEFINEDDSILIGNKEIQTTIKRYMILTDDNGAEYIFHFSKGVSSMS